MNLQLFNGGQHTVNPSWNHDLHLQCPVRRLAQINSVRPTNSSQSGCKQTDPGPLIATL
jgi:hypothetical protein